MKIIDIDSLFDKYISDYVYKNVGKVDPDEIENKIAELYLDFGKKNLKELDGKSPEEYYLQFSCKELLAGLKSHLNEGVSVPDFLCEAIISKKEESDVIISELSASDDEEYLMYLMNLLKSVDSNKLAKIYLEFLLCDYSETIKELATELLADGMSDMVSEEIIKEYQEADQTTRERFCEILAGASKSDEIFNILIAEFNARQDNIPLFAGYLAKYGDERAIETLTSAIEKEKIKYADFEELRFAIEALGGEYDKPRDFSHDKFFEKIKGSKNDEHLS